MTQTMNHDPGAETTVEAPAEQTPIYDVHLVHKLKPETVRELNVALGNCPPPNRVPAESLRHAFESADRSMNWRNHLLPHERRRIQHIEQTRPALTREFKQISDRCRKRLAKEQSA